MADTFQWLKLILDNWKTLLTVFTLLTGWAVDNNLKAEQITQTKKQVAAVAEAYYPAVRETLKTVHTNTIIRECGNCEKLEHEFDEHIKRYH
jgi:hypothetical protein